MGTKYQNHLRSSKKNINLVSRWGPGLNITAIDFLSRRGSGVGGRACGPFFNPQKTPGEPKSKNPIAESNILNPRSGTAALCLGGEFSPKHRAGVPLAMVPVGGGWAWVSKTHGQIIFTKNVVGKLGNWAPKHQAPGTVASVPAAGGWCLNTGQPEHLAQN